MDDLVKRIQGLGAQHDAAQAALREASAGHAADLQAARAAEQLLRTEIEAQVCTAPAPAWKAVAAFFTA